MTDKPPSPFRVPRTLPNPKNFRIEVVIPDPKTHMVATFKLDKAYELYQELRELFWYMEEEQ